MLEHLQVSADFLFRIDRTDLIVDSLLYNAVPRCLLCLQNGAVPLIRGSSDILKVIHAGLDQLERRLRVPPVGFCLLIGLPCIVDLRHLCRDQVLLVLRLGQRILQVTDAPAEILVFVRFLTFRTVGSGGTLLCLHKRNLRRQITDGLRVLPLLHVEPLIVALHGFIGLLCPVFLVDVNLNVIVRPDLLDNAAVNILRLTDEVPCRFGVLVSRCRLRQGKRPLRGSRIDGLRLLLERQLLLLDFYVFLKRCHIQCVQDVSLVNDIADLHHNLIHEIFCFPRGTGADVAFRCTDDLSSCVVDSLDVRPYDRIVARPRIHRHLLRPVKKLLPYKKTCRGCSRKHKKYDDHRLYAALLSSCKVIPVTISSHDLNLIKLKCISANNTVPYTKHKRMLRQVLTKHAS